MGQIGMLVVEFAKESLVCFVVSNACRTVGGMNGTLSLEAVDVQNHHLLFIDMSFKFLAVRLMEFFIKSELLKLL